MGNMKGLVANRTTLAALARQINAAHKACELAVREAVNHALLAGELLNEAKARVAHGAWKSWLANHVDCSERTAQLYMRVARELPRLDASKAQRVALLPLRNLASALANGAEVHFSSQSAEWHSPANIVRMAASVLGRIDLDPCAESADGAVPARRKYAKEDDGLAHVWRGRVYLNPPYGRDIGEWVNKLLDEYEAGQVSQAIALLPSRTDTVWFHRLRAYPRCFIRGRLRFSDAELSAPFPSMLVYLGANNESFRITFQSIGDIYRLEDTSYRLPARSRQAKHSAHRSQ